MAAPMAFDPQPPRGRVLPLRLSATPSPRVPGGGGNVISLADRARPGRPSALAEVEAHVVVCDADTVFDFAWAAHQRVPSAIGRPVRRLVTGAKTGRAQELLYTRRAGRLIPDLEDWAETLQLKGRRVAQAHLSRYRWVPAKDGHDCDCTCAGEVGHGLWEISPPAFRAVEVPALLRALVAGDRVQVLLGAWPVTPE